MSIERLRTARGPAYWALLLAIAALYFAVAKLGLSMAFAAAQVSAVWPPTGLALAAVLLLGPRVAPAVALGAFFANATAAEPLGTAAGIAVGNTLEAVAGAWLLRRGDFAPALTRLRDVLRLALLAAAGASALAATIGVASLCLGGVQPWDRFASLWLVWWQGDAMGALVVAPVLFTWLGAPRQPQARGGGELAVLALAGAAVSWLIFHHDTALRFPAPALEYAVFPFLVWAGLRHGPRGAALVTLAASAVAIAGTLGGGGPFAGRPPHEALVFLQAYMAVVALTGLLLAAAIGERDAAERRRAALAESDVDAARQAEAVLRRLERELHERVQQLAEADRRKDEFLAMLGHELRNPLAAISSGLYVLRATPPVDERGRRMLDILERQVTRLARLVDDLLEVARITRGELALRRERVDLRGVAGGAAEVARRWIAEQRHELVITLPGTPVEVDADPLRLEQVLSNLLHNAAKYTDPGGRVELVVELEGALALLRVRDNGIGIAPELLPRVFDLFVQGERSLERSHGGLGVGLTLVQRIIELHGGGVTASSAGLGYGTEVVVRLPRAVSGGSAPDVASRAAVEVPARGLSVLVVEDQADAASALAHQLRLHGHRVELAADGAAALAAARRRVPDVVLLDLGLPGMDGCELARRLRLLPGLARVPFAAITGYAREEDRRRSTAAGIDHFLVKPVDPPQLAALLAILGTS